MKTVAQGKSRFLREILIQTPVSKAKPVPTPTTDSKESVAASLKNQLLQRFRSREPEEPPQDLVHMTVLQRTEQFLKHRMDRIQEERERKKSKEVAECTFHPILYTQISPKDMSKSTHELLALSMEKSVRPLHRTRSLSRVRTSSYSERYQKARAMTPRRKSLSGY